MMYCTVTGLRWRRATSTGTPVPATRHQEAITPSGPRRPTSLPVCQVSLPRLANSVSSANHCPMSSCVQKKNEFASLPRFLSRGGYQESCLPVCQVGCHPWQTCLGSELTVAIRFRHSLEACFNVINKSALVPSLKSLPS